MLVVSILAVFIFNMNDIYTLYQLYYSESVWGILIATINKIIYLEKDFIVILIILLSIGFIGGIISKNYKDAIYSSIISGIIISIMWLILIFRFTPNYWTSNSLGILFILESILRGLIICLIFFGPCIIGGFLLSKDNLDGLKKEYPKIISTCPKCKKEFKSDPIYCCYCNYKMRSNE